MRIAILLLTLLGYISAFAQKAPLTIADFSKWNTNANAIVSANGNFVSYEINQQQADGKLLVHNMQNNKIDTIKYGYDATFSALSDFMVLKFKPSFESTRKAKLKKTKKELMPKDSIGVRILAGDTTFYFRNCISYKIPVQKGNFVAILHQQPKQVKIDTSKVDSLIAKPKASKKATLKSKTNSKLKKSDTEPNDLMVLSPLTNYQQKFTNVEEYTVSTKGNGVGVISKIADSISRWYVIYYNVMQQKIDTVYNDTCLAKSIVLHEQGEKLAFLASRDTTEKKTFSVYYFNALEKKPAHVIADTNSLNMPAGFAPSEHGTLQFSQNGTMLFLGTAPKPVNEPKDTLLDEEKPKLDVWSWTDDEIQPMQLKSLDKELKRTYTAVVHLQNKQLVPLADTAFRNIQFTNKSNALVALVYNEQPYQRESSWTGNELKDYAWVDLKTGLKTPFVKAIDRVWFSFEGKFALWYNPADSNYYNYELKTGKTVCLTSSIEPMLCDELNDVPSDPEPYGIAGWAESDKFVYLYDRYDIWKINTVGKPAPVNITNQLGRNSKISFRYFRLNPDQLFIAESDTIVLTGFNGITKEEHYYKTNFKKAIDPVVILGGKMQLNTPVKARNSAQFIWTQQSVSQYPEVHYSANWFQNPKTLSVTNPQQQHYNWATCKLVNWTNFEDETLEGLLYMPEDFDSTKVYPMVVYFYERSSDELYRHYYPYPSHSIINKTFYASNGYLVFVPDITYKIGHPGQSAYNSIVSGTQHLINTCSFVDAKHIGLQGQSWGGYQIAWLITKTDMFAAAMAGAPVSNMTSAYGGIRWGIGMSRQFQYEKTQSRIGHTLWDSTELYIENSPLFFAPNVKTPLLIMSNDNDGAVPWYQGIEYFMALRRLNKPVWLLNYNGMDHNIESKFWANRVDLSTRMKGFFDHYLKSQPAPQWMLEGIPATQKGKQTGY